MNAGWIRSAEANTGSDPGMDDQGSDAKLRTAIIEPGPSS